MKTAIGLAPIQNLTEFADELDLAKRSGFDAIELTLAAQGPFSLDTPRDQCSRLSEHIKEAGLDVSAISIGDAVDLAPAKQLPTAPPNPNQKTVAALDIARRMGTDLIIITPEQLTAQSPPITTPGHPTEANHDASKPSYEDRWSRLLDVMNALREDTEQRAVRIACNPLPSGLLLSPLEARAFIDQVSSPWIGLCLTTGVTFCLGPPQDWIRTLGHRVFQIYCTDVKLHSAKNTTDIVAGASAKSTLLGDGDVDWKAVVQAMKDIRYAGPATCIDTSPSLEGHRRLKTLFI